MERLLRVVSAFVVSVMVALALPTTAAYAGTTGAIVGRIVDQNSGAPVSGAAVNLVSPSQNANAATDANGSFRFLSLAPDTYTVTVERTGYETLSLGGVTVQADQTQTFNRALAPRLARIGGVTSRRASDLVKPGTTSDVYSVSGTFGDASAGLGGPGGLSNAYSAIQTVPGAVVQQGQQGWYQQLSIRGGDIDQVGYELDGIPVNRVYDNAPQTMLSTLGQQELQVYTGGTPATSDGQGLSGYVNQVIKTGTYPWITTLAAGVGAPAFFHRLSFEVGGSTPNRNFTFYVGSAGANQDYRYVNAKNGAGDPQLFYPIAYPFGDNFSRFNIWDGSPVPGTGAPATVGNGLYFAPANTYAIATTSQRDNVVNLHLGLPHGKNGLKDDVQFLYVTSELFNSYNGSVNDQGGPAYVGNALDVANGNAPGTSGPYQASWHDGYVYNGALLAAPNAGGVMPYFFPSSPKGRPFNGPMSNSARDTNDNGVAVLKLQYQRNISQRSYLRLFGYSVYSNWFITGESNQNFTCCFGAELNDYEIPSHTYGGSLVYSNQLNDKHLLTLGATTSQTKLQRRYFYGFPGNQSLGTAFTNLIDPASAPRTGNCFDPATGAYTSCFSSSARGTFDNPAPAIGATSFAGGASPQWLVTESGALGRVNNVSPVFSAVSLNDTWTPTDKLTLTLGLRVENYTNRLDDTSASPTGRNAANRAFWVKAYNNEYCYKPGVFGAVNVSGATPDANGVFATPANCAALGTGYIPANFVNSNGSGKISNTSFQPRLAFTYAVNPDTVVRGSFGVYARPVNTSWLQYNNLNDRDYTRYAASNFLGYGFNTPAHDLHPDTSYNYDLSLEQHLRGSDISYKATPFYRSTRDQLQAFPIGVGGIVSGFNVGKQTSYGLELALRKGDFSRDGFAGQLAYTYTHSRIKYAKFPSGTSVIDSMNLYVKDYNAYTSFCAANPTDARCGTTVGGAPAAPCYTVAGAGVACGPNTTVNPYYNQPVQNLFPVNGEYTTYDQIPQPFVGVNGYETPHVLTLILNYKHKKLAVTPSLTYSSGASYGSPLTYPGYIPDNCPNPGVLYQCTGFTSASGGALDFLFTPNAFTGRFDNLGAFKEPSRLTLNLQTSYELSRQVKLTMTMTGLIDQCYQRGYAWDNKNICVYSELPSGGAGLGPSGNFVPIAQTPVQLRYPYGMFMNNLNTGFIGTKIPFQAALDVRIKL